MIAADEYHHVDDDIAIMRDLGVRAYRFSVAWSRVLPEGRGRVNEKGMAYYLSLCDKLLSAGIESFSGTECDKLDHICTEYRCGYCIRRYIQFNRYYQRCY